MAAMPDRRAPYDPHQASRPAKASAPKPPPVPSPPSTVAEAAPPTYAIEPAWIDTAGRTRTWALRDPHGTQMAQITTKSAALKLAELLNRVMAAGRDPTR